jgi:hypothetical protein
MMLGAYGIFNEGIQVVLVLGMEPYALEILLVHGN